MPDLPRISRQQVRQQVYDAVEQAIVECVLEPRAVLKDRQLAQELGVSRTPVREALHLLESAGLVERHGLAGWRVAGLDVRDVDELFELRCMLEPAGLQRLVTWPQDRLAGLASTFDDFSTPLNKRQIARYLRKDAEFHHALIAASENRRAIQIYERVEREVHRCRHFTSYRYEGRVDQSIEEHRRICEALLLRDADTAATLLAAHIRSAKDKQIALLKSGHDALPPEGKTA